MLLIVPTVEFPPTTPPALQLTVVPVRFWVEPSLYVPVAVNSSETPKGTVLEAGVTAIETSLGGSFTVSVVDPLIVPEVALIVEVPTFEAVANPAELMLVTFGAEDVQLTSLVMLTEVPFLKNAVAVNCCVVPNGIEALAGVTVIENGCAVAMLLIFKGTDWLLVGLVVFAA